MKKTLSLLLCVVMILTTMVPVFADSSAAASVSVSSSSVKRGDTVDVTVSVTGSAEAKSLMVTLTYDTGVLELKDEAFLVSATLSNFKGANCVLAFDEAKTMNFAIAKYTFKVKPGAAYGASSVSAAVTIQNPNVSCSPASKAVTVVCAHSNAVKTPAKAATCTAAGNIEYWTCPDCGGVFSDAACKNKVSSVTVGKLGHDYVTKSNGTQHWQECSRCGDKKDAANHSFDKKDTSAKYLKTAATCKSSAVYYYSCSVCGAKGTTTFTYGDKAAHDFSKKDTSAKYLKTAATCTDPAVYFYSCAVCGEKGTKTFEGKANGHSFGAWKEDGTGHSRVCGVCGVKETAEHNWNKGVVTKQPTTTATGERKYTCKDCGAIKLVTLDKFEESDVEIKELTLTENGVTVSGKMQSGAVLAVERLEKGSELYEAAVKAVCDAFKLSADKALAAYDVRLLVKDVEVDPDGSVKVTMELPADLAGASYDLYAVTTDADGKTAAAQVSFTASGGGNMIEFTLDKLGQLVFMDNTVEPEPTPAPTPTPAPAEPTEPDGSNAWIYILIAIAAAAIVIVIVAAKKKKK